MFRIAFIITLICGIVTLSYAQDTVKKKSTVTTAPKLSPEKYQTRKYHNPKVDSMLKKEAAQKPDTAPAQPTDKSLNGQYQFLLSKIYHYQQPLVSGLWKSAIDTLNVNRAKLKAAQNRIAIQNKTIDSLTSGLTNKDQSLNESKERRDEIGILGIYLPKTTYNFIVWGLILALGIATFAVVARSAGSVRDAKYKTQIYNELEEEFKAYKAKANEKEKKLARELQTERNKVDELMEKGNR